MTKKKWLIVPLVIALIVAAGTWSYWYFNFAGILMEEKDIPADMDPEETMRYYAETWRNGDYQTMEKMWAENSTQKELISFWKETWIKERPGEGSQIRKIAKEEPLSSQESAYDFIVVYVDLGDCGNWYLVKETENSDWRIVECGNG